jgi:glycerol-3-phosphate O-acyltransferase
MNPRNLYPHIIPDISQWPILKLSENRKAFIREIDDFTFNRIKELNKGENAISDLLAKTVFLERIRIKEEPWKVDPPKEKTFWKKISQKLAQARSLEPHEKLILEDELLKLIIHRYSEEIVGTFKKNMFLFARHFLKLFFSSLLKSVKPFRFNRPKEAHFLIKGKVETVRKLFSKGNVIIVPTHFSNLDSILVGYAIDTYVGLPSFSYGAGLNLYNTGYTAYFMNRLGAYRVDRRKKNLIYLETLKAMSNLSIQRGTNSLFFPGGTRSRSGSLEEKLKLGLLSTAVEAQRKLIQDEKNTKIFVVPLIIGYHFVLEAQFLIEHHLKQIGKEKYLPGRDEFTSFRKILKFAWLIASKGNEITLSFGQPMDVLGNMVDDEGRSIGTGGELIDISDYFLSIDNQYNTDLQRESEYTISLADKILDRYKKDNIILTSHLVAHAAFLLLKRQHQKLDLYGILRLPPEDFKLELAELEHVVEEMLNIFKPMEVQLSDRIQHSSITQIVIDGINRLGNYHVLKPLYLKNNYVVSENLKLLYFYHNRLLVYKLESKLPMN